IDGEPERQHMRVVLARRGMCVQLRRGNDEQLLRGRLGRADPVVGDREHVVAGALVVPDEQLRRQLTVRIRRMGVESAAEPETGLLKGIHALSLTTRLRRESVTTSTP